MKHLLVFAALAMPAYADSTFVTASGEPVTSAYGEPWRVAAAPRIARSADVMFEFDAATLTAEGRRILDDVARRYFEADVVRVLAIAHTDRLGERSYNAGLALRRAHAVRAYLEGQGVLPSVIDIEAVGSARPVSACEQLGEESRANRKLVTCLQPDRRVQVRAE